MDNEQLGKNLKAIFETCGITLSEYSRLVGVGRQTLYRYFDGYGFKLNILRKIANYHNIDVDTIRNYHKAPEETNEQLVLNEPGNNNSPEKVETVNLILKLEGKQGFAERFLKAMELLANDDLEVFKKQIDSTDN